MTYRRLGHVGMESQDKLIKGDHILGVKDVIFDKDRFCSACQAGKQVGGSHRTKNIMTTRRPLELLHMDLFGPNAYKSLGPNSFGLVIVDDFQDLRGCSSLMINRRSERSSKTSLGRPKINLS